jgi:hypothetical protein
LGVSLQEIFGIFLNSRKLHPDRRDVKTITEDNLPYNPNTKIPLIMYRQKLQFPQRDIDEKKRDENSIFFLTSTTFFVVTLKVKYQQFMCQVKNEDFFLFDLCRIVRSPTVRTNQGCVSFVLWVISTASCKKERSLV